MLPTLAELNTCSPARVSLNILRSFCTSDLSWHCNLYSKPFLSELVRRSLSFLDDDHGLSEDEVTEFRERCAFLWK